MSTLSATSNPHQLSTVPGDGGSGALTAKDLAVFKDEMNFITKAAGYGLVDRRNGSEDTRYCRTEGQSADGLRHADAQGGEPAFPFEGAPDGRIRLADMIINERVLILVAAAMRAIPKVTGVKMGDDDYAGRMQTLLKWVIKNHFGSDYRREIIKVAQFQEGDSPAVGFLGVWWKQEMATEMRDLTLQQLAQMLVQTYKFTPDDLNVLQQMLMNPDRDAESAQWLQAWQPDLEPDRAKDVVKQLREGGKATFPAPYMRVNLPELSAYRMFDDIYCPANTPNKKGHCRMWFIREWLSEVMLRERAAVKVAGEEDAAYSESFVEEVLKHEGLTGFPTWQRAQAIVGDYSGDAARQSWNPELFKGLYEVITVVYKASNENNIPGIYVATFNYYVNEAAHDRELLGYEHGEYPITPFTREVLTQRLWDSRGVGELVQTDQNMLKIFSDSLGAHVTLTTIPPIKVPRSRPNLRLTIGPLKLIKEDRPGQIEFMEMPAYPVAVKEGGEIMMQRIGEYFGRIGATIPPLLTQLHQEGMVGLFLDNLRDVLVQLLQLCQQYMTDEDIARITGDDGQPIAHTREEIQGKFNITLSFDPRDLDMTYIKELAEIVATMILPMDTDNVIMHAKLVNRLLTAVSPDLAAETLQPVDAANQSEIKDEQNNFTHINAGIEPDMPTDGVNFQLRLNVLQDIVKKNPESYQKMSPTSKKILQARIQYLTSQVQQHGENKIIGRQGGKAALGEQPPGQGMPPGGGSVQ